MLKRMFPGTKGKMAMNKYLSVVTLNVSGLNTTIKRYRIAEWIRKHNLVYERPTSEHICCVPETHHRICLQNIYAVYKRPTSEQKTYMY